MSGLETSTVVLSAVALLVALALAVAWRHSRRDLRELRRTVDELSERHTDGQLGVVVVPERVGAGDPYAKPIGAGDPHANEIATTVPVPDRRADAIVTADGRTIVVPTTAQVVDATMGRPLVRASALAHGLRRALRTENRDRIRAMVRREFQRRRKMRQRAARRAARMAPVHQTDEGTHR
ncbi:MAG TPA: hypothetical protein VEX15_19460 [Nocardioidaceae bacterium]|nr:hypothetical protein [Nocardioidaceae bacterium]